MREKCDQHNPKIFDCPRSLLDYYSNTNSNNDMTREVKTGEETATGAVCDVICELVSVDVATEQR